ncbi:dlc-2 [Pristionchus pacificus]|uniref:Dynein light chain n=2 Tax=Pristionchus TaxID=54125 RepID=A0A2A6CBG8_PRIPA|nr:dlc-2 [Pristionchus pacificus]GMR48543.1 hypothetical protein PMAYCL1PPCAC_18738 [Pristionchus mayeri]|eukprot:PDM75479.1 dlc-2 [Pristionchus pacificus]
MENAEVKLEVKESDMEEPLVSAVLDIIREAMKQFTIDKEVATYIKERLDKEYATTWHVIVGRSFGSRVSYEMSHFLLVKGNNKVNIMLFKCGY